MVNFRIHCDDCTYSEGKTARLFVEKSGSTSHNVTIQLATSDITAKGAAVPYLCTWNRHLLHDNECRVTLIENHECVFCLLAAEGSDYQSISKEITFSPEEDKHLVEVKLFDDDVVEGSETFNASLIVLPSNRSSFSAVTVGSAVTVAIEDTDGMH